MRFTRGRQARQSPITAMDRAGLPDVTTIDYAACAKLVGGGLNVVRVTCSPGHRPTVVWRNEPTQAQRDSAELLIGPAGHAL
ncbi:MAG: hypothetical protein IID51_08585 [Proteobacteria bacterium]|nr:hypothetical protein [Pseudomonadota bacterium]